MTWKNVEKLPKTLWTWPWFFDFEDGEFARYQTYPKGEQITLLTDSSLWYPEELVARCGRKQRMHSEASLDEFSTYPSPRLLGLINAAVR